MVGASQGTAMLWVAPLAWPLMAAVQMEGRSSRCCAPERGRLRFPRRNGKVGVRGVELRDLPMMRLLADGPRRAAALGALTSVGVHLLVFTTLVVPAARRTVSSDGPILPALYLYAPDRRPAAPREWRIPIPAPPGMPDISVPGSTAEVVAGMPTPLRQQSEGLTPAGPPAASYDSVFAAIDVDSEVVRYDWSVAPAYPDSLREEGTEGYVEAEFVVDTTGRVDLETVRILTSTHWEFANSVRNALPGMLFRPAWRGVRKVRQLVGQRFAFRLIRPPIATSSL